MRVDLFEGMVGEYKTHICVDTDGDIIVVQDSNQPNGDPDMVVLDQATVDAIIKYKEEGQ
jgi:hypothetical protein